jgi:D-amino acid aminotransferase
LKTEICFLNGRYLDVRDARISPQDRGFLFGEGLFETWRTYRGHPFVMEEHLGRMAGSARELGIPFDTQEPWGPRTRQLARRNRLADTGAAIRLTITRGPGPWSLVPPPARNPTRYMTIRALDPALADHRRNGVAVHTMSFGSGVNDSLRQIKSVNYLPAILGKIEAAERGCFETLYRLRDGTVLEGTTSNIFAVCGGRLVTPPTHHGLLPGVTRSVVLSLARRLTTVEQRRLTIDELLGADEAFITSTSIEVVPVVRVGRRRVGSARPGELTRELQQRYRRHVARRLGLKVEELGV